MVEIFCNIEAYKSEAELNRLTISMDFVEFLVCIYLYGLFMFSQISLKFYFSHLT